MIIFNQLDHIHNLHCIQVLGSTMHFQNCRGQSIIIKKLQQWSTESGFKLQVFNHKTPFSSLLQEMFINLANFQQPNLDVGSSLFLLSFISISQVIHCILFRQSCDFSSFYLVLLTLLSSKTRMFVCITALSIKKMTSVI